MSVFVRRHLTYANVVATLALVFAMGGTAIAAGHYLITSTSQISPKVLKALEAKVAAGIHVGPAGKEGAAGAAGKEGPTGKEGPVGPVGTGKQGEPGEKGEQGVKGEQGIEGRPGAKGEQGLSTLSAAEQKKLTEILPYVQLVAAGVDGKPTIQFTGANVQIVNGSGETEEANGTGNLVIGYDEAPGIQTGSHNILLGGSEQTDESFGSLIGGENNTDKSSSPFSVLFGAGNVTSGAHSSVTGGEGSTAFGKGAAVTGGFNNLAEGKDSSVSGGEEDKAGGEYASVSGGAANSAEGSAASVQGGGVNDAAVPYSSVGGGNKQAEITEYGFLP